MLVSPHLLKRSALLAGVSLISLAAQPARAGTAYQGPTGDGWSNAADWSNGVPVGGSDATVNNGHTVNTDGNNATGTLTVGPVSGSGVSIQDGTNLAVGTSITNQGTITINSTNSTTELQLNNTTVRLTGSGTLALSNNANNYILDASGYSSGRLVNVGNTIQGSGTIGNGQISLDNQAAGTLNANQSVALTLNTNSTGASNEGLFEASSGGTLNISNTAVTQSGTGSILSTGAGSTVRLSNSSVSGGSLSTSNGGVIVSQGNNTLSGLTLTAGSTYTVSDSSNTALVGTITNNGNIAVSSTSSTTELQINNQTVRLTGGGSVTLSNNANNFVLDASGYSSGVLVNVDNTIQGAGGLGNGQISIDNQAAGTINANQSNALRLNTNGAGASNEGLLEASAGGTLAIQNTAVRQSNGATLLSTGAGSSVVLTNSSVTGGSLTTVNGGTISGQGNNTLSGLTLTAGSTFTSTDGSNTSLTGTIVNKGNIALSSTGSTTELQINNQTTTLTGGGTVTLSNNANNFVLDASGYNSGVLVNLDNTIQGTGHLGNGQLALNNSGVVNANNSGGSLILQGNGFNGSSPTTTAVYNSNLLEATNGGTLDIRGTVTQAGPGVVQAATGSTVLIDNAAITGGTLTSVGTGSIQGIGNSTLNSVTISPASTVTLTDGSNTSLTGTIVNKGNIALSSTGSTTELQINNQTTTLTGGGTVTLSNNANNFVLDASGYSSGVLVNADNLIQGTGHLGNGQLALNNSGVVNANNSGGSLILQGNGFNGSSPTTTAVYNSNLLEATNGGTLDIRGTVTQAGPGVVQAATGSTVLIDNAAITGGTLTSVGTGSIQGIGNSTLNSVTISPASTVTLTDGSNTSLTGTIVNKGNIALSSTGSTTELQINNQTTTLTGGGTVTLSNNANNFVLDASGYSSGVLVNADNLIQGAGGLGNGQISISNGGTILANQSNALNVNTNGAGLANNGTLQASNGATMNVTGGPLTNFSAGTLTGGIYHADAASTINLNTAAITTNAATIVLNGAGSTLNTSVGPIETTLTQNAAGGTLSILGGRDYAVANIAINPAGVNSFANAGQLQLGGGTFTSAGLSNAAGGVVSGFGTTAVVGGVTGNGTVIATGGTLNLPTGISGAGTLQVNAGATASLASTTGPNTVGTLTQNGTLALGARNITVSSDYTNANFGTGNSFNKSANVTGSGQILASGNTAQAISGANVINGGTATPTLALGQYHTSDAAHVNGGASSSFTIDNTGTTGPSLRGAIQTTGITSAGLSGSGVTAGNFGPIANGGQSGTYTVTATNSGQLTNQTIHIANNFANVAEQNVSVSGAGYNYAQASAPTTVALGNFHVGDAPTTSISIGNVAPTGAYTETLNGSVGGTSGSATASGSFNSLAAGSTSTAVKVGLSPTTAGAASGSATLNFVSNASGIDTLGNSALAPKTVQVTGTAYNLASSNTIGTVNFGVLHTGTGTQTASIGVTNTAPTGAFSEGLNSSIGSYTNNGGLAVTGSGSVTDLAAGSTDASSLKLSVSTATAGQINGSVQILQASNGTIDGLGNTALPTQNPGVTGSVQAAGAVYNYASAQINNTQPVAFGAVRMGSTQTQALSISNTAPVSQYSEALAASAGATTGSATAAGSFGPGTGSLAPGATNTSGVVVGLNTATAGVRTGSASIGFTSDGSQIAGDGTMTALAAQTVAVSGTVYRLASPTVNTSSVTLAARVGGAANTTVSVTNTSPDSYTEGLSASLGTAPAGFTKSGAVSNLAAGGTAVGSLTVGLNTATSGTFSGSQAINFISTGAGTDGATDLALASGAVSLSGKVYQAATASVSPNPISFGTVHVGFTATQILTVGNTASGVLVDSLTGGFGMVSTGFTGSGTLGSGVAAGGTSTALSVSLNTATAGAYSGTAGLALLSHDGDLADQTVATGSIALSGTVNNYAISGLGQSGGDGTLTGGNNAYTLNFGTVTQGSTQSSALFAENLAASIADLLAGSFSIVSGSGFDTSGLLSFSGLMAQQMSGAERISFSASTLGSFFETIDLMGIGSNASGYSGNVADTLLTIEGNVVLATSGGGGTSVPEPGALAILASAVAGLLALHRRQNTGPA